MTSFTTRKRKKQRQSAVQEAEPIHQSDKNHLLSQQGEPCNQDIMLIKSEVRNFPQFIKHYSSFSMNSDIKSVQDRYDLLHQLRTNRKNRVLYEDLSYSGASSRNSCESVINSASLLITCQTCASG